MTSPGRIAAAVAGLFSVFAAPGVARAALHIRTQELPRAAIRQSYDVPIETITDGRCPYADTNLALVSGALPRGVELFADGLHGTPREIGMFRFRIRAANACTAAVKDFDLVVSGRPILRVSPEELVFEYRVGGPDPQAQPVLVGSTWPGLAYSVVGERGEWLSFAATEGVTPEPGAAVTADCVWVRVKPGALLPGTYRSSLTFSSWPGANAPEVPVILKVFAAQK